MDNLRAAGRSASRAAIVTSAWLSNRLQDVTMWAVNLLRDLPLRVGRLAVALWRGGRGVLLAVPAAAAATRNPAGPGLAGWLRAVPRNAGVWLIVLISRLLDLVGAPELWSLLVRSCTHVSPLTGEEIGAAAAILGPTAIRYTDVRVAEGGLLNLVFARNRQRAFTTFHTINLPSSGPHRRANFAILLHELVHVYQYERTGGLYIAEALYAQKTAGYSYGTLDELKKCLADGASYRDFNREQQAQLVQDYYQRHHSRASQDILAVYKPLISELREGKI